jgi:hypothetical protein
MVTWIAKVPLSASSAKHFIAAYEYMKHPFDEHDLLADTQDYATRLRRKWWRKLLNEIVIFHAVNGLKLEFAYRSGDKHLRFCYSSLGSFTHAKLFLPSQI